MPRAKSDDRKSSAELNAEIKALREQLAAKQKAEKAAKRREDRAAAEAEQHIYYVDSTVFVEMCKNVYFEDHRDKTGSIYALVWPLITCGYNEPRLKRVVRPNMSVRGPNGERIRVTNFTRNAAGELVPVTDENGDIIPTKADD